MSTPAYREMDALIDWLITELDFPDRFAFYGHSMGAWVAFELAQTLRERGLGQPTHLYVGARRAPHLPDPLSALSPLSDDDFVAEVQHRYGAIPERLLRSPGLLRIFLPALRADFALLDRYTCAERPPLDIPITAFRGLGDNTVDRAEVSAWRTHTAADFQLRQVPGGHFFHREEAELLVDAIRI
jgi:medium-chain acyl-[acyl-carrier-protein] hydrolase